MPITKQGTRVYRSGQQVKKPKVKPVPTLAPRRDPMIWALFGPNYKPAGAKS